jgi:hypothetical protein
MMMVASTAIFGLNQRRKSTTAPTPVNSAHIKAGSLNVKICSPRVSMLKRCTAKNGMFGMASVLALSMSIDDVLIN